MRMKIIAAVLLAAALAGYYYQNSGQGSMISTPRTGPVVIPEVTGQAIIGKRVFDVKCSVCHGKNAAGTENGPSFINKIYRPGHHGDEAFQRAPVYGAKSHHWNFGDMPPLTGVTRGDIKNLLVYIRELQQANGIK